MSEVMASDVRTSYLSEVVQSFSQSSVLIAYLRTLNYHASLILALSLSNKGSKARWNLTSAQDTGRRQAEMNGLELAEGVLSYCAQQEPRAGQFLKTVSTLKGLLETQSGSEPEQSKHTLSWWLNSRLLRPSAPSSGSTSFEIPANSSLAPQTPFSPFDSPTYSSTSTLLDPSLPHTQHRPAQAQTQTQTQTQTDTYPFQFDWPPLNAVGPGTALNLGNNPRQGPSPPTRQHYHTFLQEFDHLDENST